MLSKNQSKLITSLQRKKYRIQHQLFIAEGIKVVSELLSSAFTLEKLFCTENGVSLFSNFNPQIISEKELSKISNFTTSNTVLAIFKIPSKSKIKEKGLIVGLDTINDPGNLGTIIRLCDWFNVAHIVCAGDTVDCYNPKVVQATMGSLARVPITYTNLEAYLKKTVLPVYGAVMDGENIYTAELLQNAILVMGNESNGISEKIRKLITTEITIPRYGKSTITESLNVASATAILLNEFRRR
ncbi:MAG TPA: RNA methyltransferase [Flavobacteriia bacterium]|jgi:TrmH family RNA methyltransferase|nr:RNA methyltransferase [Flavobacteriia bacterium]